MNNNSNYTAEFSKLDLATQKYLIDLSVALKIKSAATALWLPKIKFKKPVTSSAIILAVSDIVNESVENIISQSRKQELVHARNMSIYLLRSRGFTLRGIGELFGGRHHATVMYSVEQHSKFYHEKIDYRNSFRSVLKALNAEEL